MFSENKYVRVLCFGHWKSILVVSMHSQQYMGLPENPGQSQAGDYILSGVGPKDMITHQQSSEGKPRSWTHMIELRCQCRNEFTVSFLSHAQVFHLLY